MNTTGIHGATSLDNVDVHQHKGDSGWINLVIRSTSGPIPYTSTHEITIFSDNIYEFAQDLYEKLTLELPSPV